MDNEVKNTVEEKQNENLQEAEAMNPETQDSAAPVQQENSPQENEGSPEKGQEEAEKAKESPLPEEDDEEAAEDSELERRRAELNLDTETALLECVLFLESEPQTVESLAKITKFGDNVVEHCLEQLKEKYANADSGIELSMILGGWILTPKKECFDFVKERYGKKNEGKLSKSAIETLSIIAYSQPITRAEIESIRRVNVDNMMRVLLDRNFIKEVGKKDVPGKPTMYGTTDSFLEFFHLQSIKDLPQPEEGDRQRFELAR